MTRDHQSLLAEHTPHAIARRLAAATEHNYLRDFVLGAVDGTVTTFAVVAGVAGADLSGGVAIVMGMANLVADGFSMAVSNYLGTKSERQAVEHVRRIEESHIDAVPHGEREEIRQIYASKGFEGELLDHIVDVITNDRQQWVDTMVTEEFGLRIENPQPLRAGIYTFTAFVLAGFVPLVPFFLGLWLHWDGHVVLRTSCIATGVTFFLIGLAKGLVVRRSLWLSGLETFVIGTLAAGMAYAAGVLFAGMAGM